MMTTSADDAPAPSNVFRQRLREARERRGWSTRELADRLAKLGVKMDRAAISRIELGAPPKGRNVSLDELFALCFALNVSPAWLTTPYGMREPMRVAGQEVREAAEVRAWLRGRTWLNRADAQDQGEWVDGMPPPPLPAVYSQPEEDRLAFDSRRHPGLWRVRTAAEEVIRAALADDDEELLLELDGLAREVERQRDELASRRRRRGEES